MTSSHPPSDRCQDAVAHYIEQAREGHGEDAFHGLRDLPLECLNQIAHALRLEPDGGVRSIIIAAVREHREALILPILREAIDDASFEVFKEVLDGLVMLASEGVVPAPEVIQVLYESRLRTRDIERQEWIDEAIEQASLPPGSYGF